MHHPKLSTEVSIALNRIATSCNESLRMIFSSSSRPCCPANAIGVAARGPRSLAFWKTWDGKPGWRGHTTRSRRRWRGYSLIATPKSEGQPSEGGAELLLKLALLFELPSCTNRRVDRVERKISHLVAWISDTSVLLLVAHFTSMSCSLVSA